MPNSLDWHRVCAAFEEVTLLEDEERLRWLRQLEERDAPLAAEVRSLLENDGREAELVDIVARSAEHLDTGTGDSVPETLGGYRVIGEIGRGGLGRVFLAESEDPDFRLRVAIKVLRRSLGDTEIESRFDRERQILALLSHPQIAQVYDSGYSDDGGVQGTPYLVMELVEGLPMDTYCDQNRLDLRGRIALALQVLAAVSYAHRNLVIHRDLKPSNILVTGEGNAKLLDFGISKVLTPEQGAGTGVTGTRALLFTPSYASPEQVRGEALGTATDQYSFGCLLYQLLCGRLPYRFANLSPFELDRQLRMASIPWMSEAVSLETTSLETSSLETTPLETTSLETLAWQRRTSPSAWVRALRGDLDRIVAKTLRPEPERRYKSIDELAGDLRAFLEGRPVQARGDSWSYRGGRFLRRYRWAVAATGLIVASLLVGFAMTYRQMEQARQERARAEGVADFFVSLFEAADPAIARGKEPTVKELLHRGAETLDRTRAPEQAPEVVPAIRTTIGRVFRQLGDYEASEPLLIEAHEEWKRLTPDDALRLATTLRELGHLYDAWGKEEDAESVLIQALDRLDTQGEDNQAERSTLLLRLASVFRDQQRRDEALALLDQAETIRLPLYGQQSLEVAEIRHSRAQAWVAAARFSDAKPLLVDILNLRQRLLGSDHPLVLVTLNDLGGVYYRLGDYDEAAAALGQAADLRRRILGPDHPFVATSLINFALASRTAGDYTAARQALEEALDIQYAALGNEHPRVASTLSALGRLAQFEGAFDEARRRLEASLALRHQLLGGEHLDVAASLIELGQLDILTGDPRARERFERALIIQRRALGPDHPRTAYALLPLGRLSVDVGDWKAACPRFERVAALRESLPSDHVEWLEVEAELGLCQAVAGDQEAGRTRTRKAIDALARKQSLSPRAAERLERLVKDSG